MTECVQLALPDGAVIATANVVRDGDLFTGSVDLTLLPPALRASFSRFEEIVNGQVFSLLDETELEIASLKISARFGDRQEELTDLQIYPSEGAVSFRLRARMVSNIDQPTTVAHQTSFDPLAQENRL